jgi:hypothetical protein
MGGSFVWRALVVLLHAPAKQFATPRKPDWSRDRRVHLVVRTLVGV